MDAFDVMTTTVFTVSPETPARQIAELLLEKGISAVPVVDEAGAVIGMVSEGDLLRHSPAEREARRDWWLALLAQGETLSPEFLATLRAPNRTAREIMSAPVVTVSEHTDIAEIGKLLATHRIKRVPVVREGRVVGIVSRADLIRAFTKEEAAPHSNDKGGLFSWSTPRADGRKHIGPEKPPEAPPIPNEGAGAASDLRALVEAAELRKAAQLEAARKAAAGLKEHKVQEAIEHHIADSKWRELLHQARQAAEQGEEELLILRFPAELCSDGGRAINVPEPTWPATLRGEAAETYLRFEHELKPLGFHLLARVLDFPGGFIGDIGLFLYWGGAN
jgi:CBS domain-containing protein